MAPTADVNAQWHGRGRGSDRAPSMYAAFGSKEGLFRESVAFYNDPPLGVWADGTRQLEYSVVRLGVPSLWS